MTVRNLTSKASSSEGLFGEGEEEDAAMRSRSSCTKLDKFAFANAILSKLHSSLATFYHCAVFISFIHRLLLLPSQNAIAVIIQLFNFNSTQLRDFPFRSLLPPLNLNMTFFFGQQTFDQRRRIQRLYRDFLSDIATDFKKGLLLTSTSIINTTPLFVFFSKITFRLTFRTYSLFFMNLLLS